MREIKNVTLEEVKALFKYSNLDDFEVVELRYDTDAVIVVAKSVWTDGEGEDEFEIEDEVCYLYKNSYEDICDFSDGFKVPMTTYIQWLLWCGFVEPIEEFEIIKPNDYQF